MQFLLLTTHPSRTKQLVNMSLVSEAVSSTVTLKYTRLVVPSASEKSNRFIEVTESIEEIQKLLES